FTLSGNEGWPAPMGMVCEALLRDHSRFGFGYNVDASSTVETMRTVAGPQWVFLLILGPAPLCYLAASWRRRGRTSTAHCQTCGYDLRATPAPRTAIGSSDPHPHGAPPRHSAPH